MTRMARFTVYYGIASGGPEGVITSAELGRLAGIGSSQVRRDLMSVRLHGKRGTGYQCGAIIDSLEPIVRRNQEKVSREMAVMRSNASHISFAFKALRRGG